MEYLYLAAGQIPFVIGILDFRAQQKYRDIFLKIENSRVFDMEYLSSTDDIPMRKPVALRAIVQCDIKNKLLTNPETDCVASKVTAVFTSEVVGEDEYAPGDFAFLQQSDFNEPVYLVNEKNERIMLSIPEEGFMVHNIDTHDSNTNLSLLPSAKIYSYLPTKLKSLFKKYSTRELYFEAGRGYIFMGDLTPTTKGGVTRSLTPYIVSGEMKESAMHHLDNLVKRHNQRSKLMLGLGLTASTLLLCYKRFIMPMINEEE